MDDLIQGGQGRTDASVMCDAGIVWLCLKLAMIAIVAATLLCGCAELAHDAYRNTTIESLKR